MCCIFQIGIVYECSFCETLRFVQLEITAKLLQQHLQYVIEDTFAPLWDYHFQTLALRDIIVQMWDPAQVHLKYHVCQDTFATLLGSLLHLHAVLEHIATQPI
jgi:hypothetical protein